MIYPLFHAFKRDFQYFTCIRNGQKKAWHVPLFPDGVGPTIFSGGSVAPNAKCYQLLRAIGRKRCFLNILNPHTVPSPSALKQIKSKIDFRIAVK